MGTRLTSGRGAAVLVVLALLLVVLALLLDGCGASTEEEASEAIATSITADAKGAGVSALDVTAEEAACIGDGWVRTMGVEELQRYGVLTEDLHAGKSLTEVDEMSDAAATSATAVLFDCADIPSMMKKVVAGSGQVSGRMQACVAQALTEETLRPYLEATFQGRAAEAQRRLTEPMSACAPGAG